MKIFYLILLCFLPQLSFGQQLVDQTISAINKGDISEMSQSFDKMVDVTLNNEQTTYSKSQATVVLKKFFEDNGIKSFTVKHKGSPGDKASIYIIGTLKTKTGKDFRLYLFFKQKNEGLFLQEVRIE